MKLRDLLESKEKNLIGLKIVGGLFVDEETKNKHWPGSFNCNNMELTSLEGSPGSVSVYFYCYANQLTSLKYSPTKVGGNFDCSDNNLTSLKDIHKHVKEIRGGLYAYKNPIKSHVLGVLLINKLLDIEIDNKEVQEILLKYLPNTRGHRAVAECQDELIEAGLDDFAQL